MDKLEYLRSQAGSGEVRAVKAEIRTPGGDDESKKVAGLGIVVDQWTEIFPGFKERVNKGAVKRGDIVKSYFNHDPDRVLSTTGSNPPLQLKETKDGLEYESPIPPTSYGKDLEVNLERGNVKGSSFTFSVPRGGDKMWEDDEGVLHREIKELTLYEVGPVTDPAYIQTTAAVRSAQSVAEEYRQQAQASKQADIEQQQNELNLLKMKTEIKNKELI